jgi:hypothetical protein
MALEENRSIGLVAPPGEPQEVVSGAGRAPAESTLSRLVSAVMTQGAPPFLETSGSRSRLRYQRSPETTG